MRLSLDLQIASRVPAPTPAQFRRWARAALAGRQGRVELSLRLVDRAEGARLNRRYRGKRGATNVLSFPCEALPGLRHGIIGDLVICGAVVEQEAKQQHKGSEAHWAHMVIHGTLHLLGHDHVLDDEARRMEALETEIMARLGYPDPYHYTEGKAA